MAIMLLIPSVLPVQAEDAPKYDMEYNRLVGLGLMEEAEDIDFGREISRIEFVKILAKYLQIDENLKNATVSEDVFADIDKDYPDAATIKYIADIGYVQGFSDNMFYPEEKLTFSQAVKIAVCVLGYSNAADSLGGYPKGYEKIASDIGILKGVSRGEEYCTYGNVIKLLDNCLETDMMEMNFDGNHSSSVSNETFLSSYYDITVYEGIVEANQYTSLTSASGGVGKGKIGISGNVYEDITGMATHYLGYRVEFYVKENDSGVETVIYMVPDRRTETETVKGENINISTTTDYMIYYFNSKERSTYIDMNQVKLIYNGRALSLFDRNTFLINCGEMTLLDNDGDGKTDIVFMFSASEAMVVDRISASNNNLYFTDTLNGEKVYKIDGERNETGGYLIIKDGIEITPEEISSGDILTIGTHPDGGVMIYVGGESITGTVNAIESDYINYAEIDSVKYPLYGVSLSLALSGTFYVNKIGYICGYKMEKQSGPAYGMLLTTKYIPDVEENQSYRLTLLDEQGEKRSYYLGEKVRINGNRKDAEDAFAMIESADSQNYDLGRKHNISSGKAVRQVIRYSVDENNYISEILLVTPNGELQYSSKVDVTYRWAYGMHCLQNYFFTTANTLTFYLTDNDEDMYVKRGEISFIFEGDKTDYTVYAYDITDEKTAPLLVIDDRKGGGATGTAISSPQFGVVVKKGHSVDEEGLPVETVVCMVDGTETKLLLNDKMPASSKATFNSLKKGDVVFFSKDGKGRLSVISRVFDESKKSQVGACDWSSASMKEVHGATNYSTCQCNIGITYVKVKKIQGSVVIFNDNNNEERVVSVGGASSKAYIVTKSNRIDVKAATCADIRPGDMVLVRTNYATFRECLIIRDE